MNLEWKYVIIQLIYSLLCGAIGYIMGWYAAKKQLIAKR